VPGFDLKEKTKCDLEDE